MSPERHKEPLKDRQPRVEILVGLGSILMEMKQELGKIPFYQSFCAGKMTAPQLAMVYRQFYPYIAQTPKTLQTIADRARKQYASHPDPLHRDLWKQFQLHEEAEAGHENLLLKDLATLGYMTSAEWLVDEATEPVKTYIQGAQTMAETYPVGNIGEAWLLEGITPSVEGMWSQIVANSGISNIENAVSFMQIESEADIDHLERRRKFIRQLEKSSNAAEHWQYIKTRAEEVKTFYVSLWRQFDASRDIQTHEDTWASFQRLAAGERAEVDQRLKQGHIVVIDGPFGVGKNLNIVEPFYIERTMDGYKVVMWEGNYEGDEAVRLPKFIEERVLPELLGEGDRRFFIIDEFPGMIRLNPEGTEHVLRILHDGKIEVLLINSYRTQAMRDYINQAVLAIGEKNGIPISIHRMQITHLPPELAREHLAKVNGADKDLIDFVTEPENNALLVPRVFNLLVEGCKTMDDLREKARKDLRNRFSIPDLLDSGQGGSKDAMVRALRNMGIELSEERVVEAAEYN